MYIFPCVCLIRVHTPVTLFRAIPAGASRFRNEEIHGSTFYLSFVFGYGARKVTGDVTLVAIRHVHAVRNLHLSRPSYQHVERDVRMRV